MVPSLCPLDLDQDHPMDELESTESLIRTAWIRIVAIPDCTAGEVGIIGSFSLFNFKPSWLCICSMRGKM